MLEWSLAPANRPQEIAQFSKGISLQPQRGQDVQLVACMQLLLMANYINVSIHAPQPSPIPLGSLTSKPHPSATSRKNWCCKNSLCEGRLWKCGLIVHVSNLGTVWVVQVLLRHQLHVFPLPKPWLHVVGQGKHQLHPEQEQQRFNVETKYC